MATGTARHNGPVSKAIAELEISTRRARFDAFRATLLKILLGKFPGSGSGQTRVLPSVGSAGESSDAGQY